MMALLTLGGAALAQPSDNPGRGHGASQGQGQGNGKHQRQSRPVEDDRGYREDNRHFEDRADRERRDYRDRRDGPDIEEREIRRIFEQSSDRLSREEIESLPPGIRKNLARGKPLPPGIAKRFDDRLVQELPSYPGYEWRRAGSDAILVDATNEIIYRVLTDILR
ncbi:MAG TPA: anti-virulence regulator CigR family protein [Halomonas sp.]|nr:anti-virulence regulator CigR family protein [Halomonas sp.]